MHNRGTFGSVTALFCTSAGDLRIELTEYADVISESERDEPCWDNGRFWFRKRMLLQRTLSIGGYPDGMFSGRIGDEIVAFRAKLLVMSSDVSGVPCDLTGATSISIMSGMNRFMRFDYTWPWMPQQITALQ